MTSEDVIHDFFVPAFRVKNDVLPGRYTTIWFEATKPGEYRLFLLAILRHAALGHDRPDHRDGTGGFSELVERRRDGGIDGDGWARIYFERLGCVTCHAQTVGAVGAVAGGARGQDRCSLQGGETITADEDYIRESISNPHAKIVAGYQPIMPTFKGSISEDGIMQIIAYLKSLKRGGRSTG